MNERNFRKYIAKLREKLSLTDEVLEQDYQLSKLLTEIQKLDEQGKIEHLNKLIFKGGTLLTKAYLGYHRISEDLDFTHEQSNELRDLSKGRRETKIKDLIIPIIEEIKLVSDKCGFDFKTKRDNKKYIRLINSRSVYILTMYYKSIISGQESFIKFEINFVEKLNNKPVAKTIKNLHQILRIYPEFLRSINFDLKEVKLMSYPLDEIMIEKFRAIITRNQLKERDMIDLYLISKQKDVFSVSDKLIIQKIKSGEGTIPRTIDNLKSNYDKIVNGGFDNSTDEVNKLLINPIDKTDYTKFKTKILKKLKKVCETILS